LQLKEEEQRYLQCLADQMSFQGNGLGARLDVDEVIEFGDEFFTRAFESIRRKVS
jgi:hypothetical protein